MASEVPNGHTYTPHQPYGTLEQNNYGYADSAASQAPPTSSTPASTTNGQPELSKDEVGWYFVEQYYTTLSRSPDKLYLFYNKRSQFVSGRETDKVQVCIGQRAINDKIKQLDFQDCKVRVTNVDSQASDSNIVIQVIGEISNKSQPHKKFTQTFVLGTQTNGYFVLNDIFRYLIEEDDEPEAESTTTQQAPQPTTNGIAHEEPAAAAVETQATAPIKDNLASEPDAEKISKELEEKVVNTNSTIPTPAPAEDRPSTSTTEPSQPAPAESAQAAPATSVETTTNSEVPKEPEPTRASTPQVAAPQQTPAAPKAAVPKTWAARLAASAVRVATPVAPVTPAAAPRSTSTGAKATPATPSTNPVPPAEAAANVPVVAPAQAPRQDGPAPESDEWTSVGTAHNRQQSRPVGVAPVETPQFRGYIKNVHDGIHYDALKAALDKFGKVAYFDVARHKNCAFVDFETADGYNKATTIPIELGDDKLMVEERRPQNGPKIFANRGQFQGGRGRGNYNNQGPPRGGFQNNRGNGVPRGRGGPGAGGRGTRGAPAAS